jgi:hypothetical protein
MAGRAQFGGRATDDMSRDAGAIAQGLLSMFPDLNRQVQDAEQAKNDTEDKADEQLTVMQEVAQYTKAMAEGLPVVRVAGAF